MLLGGAVMCVSADATILTGLQRRCLQRGDFDDALLKMNKFFFANLFDFCW